VLALAASADGRIVVAGEKAWRRPKKRADYLLRYRRDLPLAVVEAKAGHRLPADGLQQAKDYARILGLTFAYATNGHGIVEFDFATGLERELREFPSPAELWARLCAAEKLSAAATGPWLTPFDLNADLARQHPDLVCRVTADEGGIGRGHMQRFQDVETRPPVILTTSQLLTTGLDAPTCRNVVLVRLVNSMVEFKQIIGRGTRVRDDYGKLWFTILDYTGSATRNFADPAFDGSPVLATQEEVDEQGHTTKQTGLTTEDTEGPARALPATQARATTDCADCTDRGQD
jgi:type I site-specific restriction endonuclease